MDNSLSWDLGWSMGQDSVGSPTPATEVLNTSHELRKSSSAILASPREYRRAKSATSERQLINGASVPSVSALSKDLEMLSLHLAELGEMPSREGRLTSAPVGRRQRYSAKRDVVKMTNSGTEVANTSRPTTPVELMSRLSTAKGGHVSSKNADELAEKKEAPSSSEQLLKSSLESQQSIAFLSPSLPPLMPSPPLLSSALFGELPEGTGAVPSPLAPSIPSVTKEPPATLVPNAKGRDGRIRVIVRKRPFNPGEPGADCIFIKPPQLRIVVMKQRIDLSEYEESSEYAFDDTYEETATNESIYQTSIQKLLKVSLAGGSASCFAYGQTGSGKTYTMMGNEEEKGLYLLAAMELFGQLKPGQELIVSFYEIYCNSLFDLMNRRHPIVVREDANRKVNICGLTWHPVTTAEALFELVKAGMDQRRTGSTSANEHSSRSHAVMSIRIKDSRNLDFMGVMNFVDLAGSERAADTANNDRLTRLEGAEINKSLLALKECIRALDEKKRHVPFRGSRLTEVLRDSFTGSSESVMIANVSPSSASYEHTSNTLRYAFRVQGLSIPAVGPSKARNAPRPFNVVPRIRGVGAVPDGSPPLVPEELVDDGGDRLTRPRRSGGAGSPVKRRVKRRRYPAGRRRDEPTSASDGQEITASPVRRRTDGELPRLPPRAPTRAMRNVVNTEDDLTAGNLGTNGDKSEVYQPFLSHRLSALLTPSTAPESYLVPPSKHAINKVPLAPLNGYPRSVPPKGGEVDSNLEQPSTSMLTSSERNAIEQHLTVQIMEKLRDDLGKQLGDVLDEKDAIIAALRKENEQLKRSLTRVANDVSYTHPQPTKFPLRGTLPPAAASVVSEDEAIYARSSTSLPSIEPPFELKS